MRLCSAHPALLMLTLELTEEALKIHPWWKFLLAKMQVPAILLKTNSTTGIIYHGFAR